MEDGWIKLHRKMREWQHYQRPSVRLVFEELLFCANTKPTWFHGVKVDRGETFVSVSSICEYTGFARATVVDALKILVETKEIEREKCWKGIKTKIINFDKYQDSDSRRSSSENEPQEVVSSSKNELQTELHTELHTELEQELKKEKNIYLVENARTRVRKILDELLVSRITVEGVCKNEGISFDEFKEAAEYVVSDWEFTNPEHKNDNDIRQHLLSTIKIKIRDKKRNETAKQKFSGYEAQRQAEREQLTRGVAATIARRLAEDDARAAKVR